MADGITTTTEQAWVYSGGIRIGTSDTTPAAGQVVTITVVAAEALRANPTVWVTQPGRSRVTYRTTKTGTSTYSVQVRLRTRLRGPPDGRGLRHRPLRPPAAASVAYWLH